MKKNYLLLSKDDHWVRPFFKKYKKLLALVLFLGFLTFFAASALMFTSGYLISKSATKPENILLVYVPIVLTRAFGIARPTFRHAERLGSHNWVLKMTSDIRLKLYQSLESKAAKTGSNYQSGSLLGLLAEDIDHIQNLYLRTIFPAFIALVMYVFIILGLGWFSIPFALLMMLLFGIILILLPLLSILVNNARMYRLKEKRHGLYNDLTDAVLGVGDWQYSGRYHDFLEGYNTSEAAVRVEDEKMNRYTRWEGLVKQVVFGAIAVSLFVWAGNYFGATGEQAMLNWIAAFVLAFFPLIDAFAPVSDSIRELPIYEDTVVRLSELPSPSVVEKETVLEAITLPHTGIRIEDVTYRYPDSQRDILTDFSLSIEEGEVIALLGKSGTGKTTLSQLLRGDLQPDKGEVTIGGHLASELTGQASRFMGVLNQRPYLFNTSLRNNVQMGNLEATDEALYEAIEKAGLSDVVNGLPEGIDTLVEENGRRFSGGEQQRIALARILLQDAPIVVIDEPTIGLDPITEKQLLKTVFDTLSGKTVVWITHHLVGIHHADRVVFLEDGAIMMDGGPKELLETNKRFKELYRLDLYE